MVPEGNVLNKTLCLFNFAFSESPNTLSWFFGFVCLFVFLSFLFLSHECTIPLQVCSQLLQSCPALCKPLDYSQPGSWRLPRQEDWDGLPFSPPADLPHPGIKPLSPALTGRFSTTNATRENLIAAHSATAKENTPC